MFILSFLLLILPLPVISVMLSWAGLYRSPNKWKKHFFFFIYPATMFDTAHRELPDKFGKYLKAVISWTDFAFDPYIKEN